MDLYYSGDVVTLNDDRQTIGIWGLRDKMVIVEIYMSIYLPLRMLLRILLILYDFIVHR